MAQLRKITVDNVLCLSKNIIVIIMIEGLKYDSYVHHCYHNSD